MKNPGKDYLYCQKNYHKCIYLCLKKYLLRVNDTHDTKYYLFLLHILFHCIFCPLFVLFCPILSYPHFMCFEESYPWSYFILIQALFLLIHVLFSYPSPIFSEYFLENSEFFWLFRTFSDFFWFFLMQSGIFLEYF